jgi:NAD(P)-dependent dehydrogenase (short-subunit alcohol dehydrogenase family)
MPSYADVHAAPNGAGDARPTAQQIVHDHQAQGRLAGKFAVVTGASSGIGVETVRALLETGLKFFLPVRSLEKTKTALGRDYDTSRIELIFMDQTSLGSVREAAKLILSKTDKINMLINNAGIMSVPELQLSEDGHELHFATNHLAHFLLFQLLKPALLAGSTPEFQSRVVAVTSDGHKWKSLNESGKYDFQDGGYDPNLAYGQSKTANIYMANEIDRRYGAHGLHATSVHPGVIATKLGRYLSEEQLQQLHANPQLAKIWKSPEQGAATTVWAAVAPEWEGRGGRYLVDCAEAVAPEEVQLGQETQAYASWTYSPDEEKRLWRDSLAMVGLQDDDQ